MAYPIFRYVDTTTFDVQYRIKRGLLSMPWHPRVCVCFFFLATSGTERTVSTCRISKSYFDDHFSPVGIVFYRASFRFDSPSQVWAGTCMVRTRYCSISCVGGQFLLRGASASTCLIGCLFLYGGVPQYTAWRLVFLATVEEGGAVCFFSGFPCVADRFSKAPRRAGPSPPPPRPPRGEKTIPGTKQ